MNRTPVGTNRPVGRTVALVAAAVLATGSAAGLAAGSAVGSAADDIQERTITFLGVTGDSTDFEALEVGAEGWWFANFDAPEPVTDRPTGEGERSALPPWVAPLNHFSLDECDLVGAPEACLEQFLTRTFSQDGPSRSVGGQPDWAIFTLPDGSVGRSGAIVDPFTAGNSNNTINRVQLVDGVPDSFVFHIVVGNTAGQHDPTNRLRPRGNIGETPDDVEADVMLTSADLVFPGAAATYSFRYDGFEAGDYIKLQLNGDPPPAGGASIAGFLFDAPNGEPPPPVTTTRPPTSAAPPTAPPATDPSSTTVPPLTEPLSDAAPPSTAPSPDVRPASSPSGPPAPARPMAVQPTFTG